MGAWIEICRRRETHRRTLSHPTMGAWIEIQLLDEDTKKHEGRTPRWVRGLKFTAPFVVIKIDIVAPHDGCVD